MFTGIVTSGEVVSVEGSKLQVRSDVLAGAGIGASVAVNGTCLTVVEIAGEVATFDVSAETFARTALVELTPNARVNVERPMTAGAEFGGHIVQGHVDGIGVITKIVEEGAGERRLTVALPEGLGRYIVQKGSVTVDGVSLTIAELDEASFSVALIPQTLAVTTFGEAIEGRKVNLEVDVLAKYVEKLMPAYVAATGPGSDPGKE